MKKQQNLAAHDECEEEVVFNVLNQFSHISHLIYFSFWVKIPKKLINILFLAKTIQCTINSADTLTMSNKKFFIARRFSYID